MYFRIADTFTDSLARLTGDEQKAVKTTAFDLQIDPANPGMQFHKLDKAKDRNFWSVRVSGDIRLIVHRTKASLLLCYVDHHDAAYRWAERRKLETHPKTGAAQLVELRETVREITVEKYVEAERPATPKRPLFANISDDELLGFGVPSEWLADVKQADEDSLLVLSDHLPREAAEALFDVATGIAPRAAPQAAAGADPFEHPDARRRFRVISDADELERALDYPWEKWAVFLHPAQREVVERRYNGPARVAGSAGTGKTIVALHRAAFLARTNPHAKVLITTFSPPLANAFGTKLKCLMGNEPAVAERVEVQAIGDVGRRIYAEAFGVPEIADEETQRQLLADASQAGKLHRFSSQFLWAEWSEVVDAWQLESWEAYRTVARLGRKTRLAEPQRRLLWDVFERVRQAIEARRLVTSATVFAMSAKHATENSARHYDFIVVDEAQDLSVPQLRFLAVLASTGPNGLFFAGDLGQRIFQPPFSWKSLGVDIRGRSQTLRINYRTSHQIRRKADRLLPPELADVDGNAEQRRGTVSVFNGPEPAVEIFATQDGEQAAVGKWLAARREEGVPPAEIAVFVRSQAQLPRALRAVDLAEMRAAVLDDNIELQTGRISLATLYLAKGLEFKAVAIMACDDEVIPLQERIDTVGDEADLEVVFDTERHLLYVGCTRARDHLLITSVDPASEFLDDF